MSKKLGKSFEDYVIAGILANNEFGIKEVEGIQNIKAMIFRQEDYKQIIEIIKTQNWSALNEFPENDVKFREYLDIISFYDQNKNLYFATVYDSDELMQDPQIIDIFKASVISL